MKTILITGAGKNGVTGRLVKEYFQTDYIVLAPSSQDLDLTDNKAVADYFRKNKIDYVIHCATFRPSSIHAGENGADELTMNLRMFMSLAQQKDMYEKMVYLGSGAEYDKRKDIVMAKEEQIGDSIPADKYGLGKYMMNEIARSSNGKIVNLRIFGTINAYERPDKNVISNICAKIASGAPVVLRQDCRFSFVPMIAVLPVIKNALLNELKYSDYNIVSDKTYLISEIAEIANRIAESSCTIAFSNGGLGREYTASNQRMRNEFHNDMDVENAIKEVYSYVKSHLETFDIENIDKRWA